MKPFYFGPAGSKLFGVHHASENMANRHRCVVLCYPLGNEYIRIHRTFRQLAARLAKIGFHVLRFDYYGTGDSAGDSTDAELDRWLADISTAVTEMKRIAGVNEIHLAGLRLGAALALMAGSAHSDIAGTVLWEPIVSGKGYLEQQVVNSRSGTQNGRASETAEIAGLPVTSKMWRDLEKINLLSIKGTPVRQGLVLEPDASPETANFVKHLSTVVQQVECQIVAGSGVWDDPNEFGQGIVPYPVLQSITSWMGKISG